jgi:hypothetical protein
MKLLIMQSSPASCHSLGANLVPSVRQRLVKIYVKHYCVWKIFNNLGKEKIMCVVCVRSAHNFSAVSRSLLKPGGL